MPYCYKCGAYIPDGQTSCLACGYDEEAENNKSAASSAASSAAAFSAAAAAAAQSFSDEVRKKVAEEKRRMQQEADKKWAEEEHRRREQAQREQEEQERREERRAAQEQAYSEPFGEADSENHGSYTSTKRYSASAQTQPEAKGANKTLAALSYLSALCFLPFFFCPNDDYAKYHAKQGLRLFILSLFSDIASLIPIVGAVFTIFRFYCIYKGMTNASSGKCEPLPYIGEIGKF